MMKWIFKSLELVIPTAVNPTAVTHQRQDAEDSYNAQASEESSNFIRIQALQCTLTDIRLRDPLGCVIKQAGINSHTIPNMWGPPGIELV